MQSTMFKKFFILNWKNLLGKKRHWLGTLLEIIVPTVLFCALVALRNEGTDLNPVEMPAEVYSSVPLQAQYCTALIEDRNETQLLYYPDNNVFVNKLMKTLEARIGQTLIPLCALTGGLNYATFVVRAVNNSEDIETIAASTGLNQDDNGPLIYGGVVFDVPDSGDIGSELKYQMRLLPKYTQSLTDMLYPPYSLDGPQNAQGEAYNIQTAFQALIDLAFTEEVTGEQLLLKEDITGKPAPEAIQILIRDIKNIKVLTGLQQMAFPAYLQNNLTLILTFMLPLFLVLSFAFIVPPVLKRIVYEKETGVKELMKMMGLPSWLHWLCWYLNSMLTSIVSVLIITALLHITFKQESGPILTYSDPFCTFILLLLYASALVLQLFTLSIFFNQPNLALGLGILFHMMTFFIPNNLLSQTQDGYSAVPFGLKMFLGLLPNINLIWGVKSLMELEGRGTGMTWSTLYDRPNPSDPLTMGSIWLMFLVDILFYSLLISYLDKVRPGKYGVARPWYFPFLPSTWKCGSTTVHQIEAEMERTDESMFEVEPGTEAGIKVHGLRKEFPRFRDSPVVAVDKVSFSAYHGEITTLLGHNGAGKTTTMSVLTGLFSPTAGRAFINGFDIATNMSKVRESLGLCPQHNMLFEDLTVREHFVFFGMLKGLTKRGAESESKKYIEMLNLVPKKNVIVTALSGGMKRKVNLGIALIGGSKVVMLDEPTSGMDPEARRGMWDLLLSIKSERTILLTTHFMEEADVLGDRIAIMASGKVQCYGSPFFLKKRFGSGYTLNIAKEELSDSNPITNTVLNSIPGSAMMTETGQNLSLSLPTEESARFPDMFKQLETNSANFGIEDMSLNLTSMEDVFLKIGEMTEQEKAVHEEETGNGHLGNGTSSTENLTNGNHENGHRKPRDMLSGLKLYSNQLIGLLIKRAVYTYRRPILYLVLMLVPIAMSLLTVFSLNGISGFTASRGNLDITLKDYSDPFTFVGSDNAALPWANAFIDQLPTGGSNISTNVTETILENSAGSDRLSIYKESYIIGADFEFMENLNLSNYPPISIPDWNGVMASGIFNSLPLHSKPLAQMQLSNGILAHLEAGSATKHTIATSTYPLPESDQWQLNRAVQGELGVNSFIYGIVTATGISILVSCFVIFPLNERATSAKQVQIMAGLPPVLFWISNLLWDVLIYLISITAMYILILSADDNRTFNTYGAPGALYLILVFLGLFGIPFSYVTSFAFNTPAAGFSFLIVANILAGAIAPVAVLMLRQFGSDSDDLTLASDIVRWIFTWFPIFPFSRALMAIAKVQDANNVCEKIDLKLLTQFCTGIRKDPSAIQQAGGLGASYLKCCTEDLVGPENQVCDLELPGLPFSIPCHTIQSFFTWDAMDGINLDLVMLVVDGVLLVTLLVLIEMKVFPKILNWLKSTSLVSRIYFKIRPTHAALDEDVLAEQERSRRYQEGDLLKVMDLQKKFKRLHAVQGLSFGVKHGECFGLLGINGAGKTTSFRMLTGDEVPTSGSAVLQGERLGKNRRHFLRNIGYCPQFDSIIPELTGRELLNLMCRVRGVPSDRMAAEVARWTNFLGIQMYIDRASGSYSGGNKRKLNVAMALVGESPIIFLDEPSTGVDPVARRNLWTIIQRIQKNGQAVVLTSHSMEECEALCDRLGIMVNGQFQCFGTVPHLKNKFAQGFTINLKLGVSGMAAGKTDQEEIISAVQRTFQNTTLKDRHMGYLQFQVDDTSIPLSQLFRQVENIKASTPSIEEYSIKETTLEQVFLSFARKQLTTI